MGIDTIRKLVSRKSVNTFLDAKVRLKLDAMVYTFGKVFPPGARLLFPTNSLFIILSDSPIKISI